VACPAGGVVAVELDKAPSSLDMAVHCSEADCTPDTSIVVSDTHTNWDPFVGASEVEGVKRWGSSHRTSIAPDLKNYTHQEEVGALEVVPSVDDAVLLVWKSGR